MGNKIAHQGLTFAQKKLFTLNFCAMERKLINSVVNGILRNHFDSEENTLRGIALWLCRQMNVSLKDGMENHAASLEDLFVDGEEAAHKIAQNIPREQLRLLEENFALTAETLLLLSYHYGFKPTNLSLPVTEAASRFLFSFLRPHEGSIIYNPFGGDYYAPGRYPQYRFVSPNIDGQVSDFSILYQAARGLGNSTYFTFNPFLNPEGGESVYDSIYIPAMPYGVRIMGFGRKIEENYILNALRLLRGGGRMVVVLPAMALTADSFFELRKTLLDKRILRRVILFPTKALWSNTTLSTVAFVLENSWNENPYFYLHDLSKGSFSTTEESQELFNLVAFNDPAASVTIEYSAPFSTHNVQILPPSASLQRIERPGFKYVRLGELLSPYRKSVELDGTEMVARLSGKDMHLTLPDYMIDIQDVEITPARGRFTRIEEPVLCFHGITQNYVWCIGEKDYPVYCNSDIYTFRISSELISPEYLCFVLGQEDILADIKSRVSGYGIPRITRQALLDVAIPVPDQDRQDLVTQELQRFISDQKTMLAEQQKRSHEADIEDIREDIKDKIHLLGPYNTNVQTGIHRIVKMLQRGDKLEAGTEVYKDSGIELLGFLKSLLVKSEDAGYIMASIGESIFEEAEQPLDAFTFIQEYVARLQSDEEYEGISFEITPIKRPCYMMITERSLRLVLDTIVRNAVLHGFSDAFSGPRKIRFGLDVHPGSGFAVISVANNGLPAAEGFTQSLYEGKFGKCGPTAHSGRGGFFVARAMAYYKGYVIVNTSDKKWPFDVWLHIPISHE